MGVETDVETSFLQNAWSSAILQCAGAETSWDAVVPAIWRDRAPRSNLGQGLSHPCRRAADKRWLHRADDLGRKHRLVPQHKGGGQVHHSLERAQVPNGAAGAYRH